MMTSRKMSFSYYVRQFPIESVMILSGVCLLIILLLLLLQHQRTKNSRASAIEFKKRLRIYAMSNDYLFEYGHEKNSLMVSFPSQDKMKGAEMKQFSFTKTEWENNTTPFWELIRSRKDGTHEIQQPCSDDKLHWLRVTVETIYQDDGAPAYTIGKINLIDEEREERDALQTRASRESLTGLFNINSFKALVGEAVDQMKEGETGAFILLDIDRFKSINDTFGHLQGDAALTFVARMLSENTRAGDIVGRFGGDEFVAYFNNIRDGAALADKCASLCRLAREQSEIPEMTITLSIGGVLSARGDDYSALFQTADQMLYLSKNAGRDQFRIADSIERE